MLGYYGVESGMCIHVVDQARICVLIRLLQGRCACACMNNVTPVSIHLTQPPLHIHTHVCIGPLLPL